MKELLLHIQLWENLSRDNNSLTGNMAFRLFKARSLNKVLSQILGRASGWHSSSHEAARGEKINLMLYLWTVIIYLFDYFVNYLSIELLILLHDFPFHYS